MGRYRGGDIELAQWIGRYGPGAVLCGHVHQSPFRPGGAWLDRIGSTWVFNAGRQYGRPPTHIILDSTSDRALVLPGRQSVGAARSGASPCRMTKLPDWLMLTARVRDPTPG
jgi:hypothetical protein